jgi:putative SOS response-associated peptidase YedK
VPEGRYKHPWARGQRCIIPAESFFEPCWETGKHVPWRFRQASGEPWGPAGLWNVWTAPETGELVETYTMLTINADDHPLMSRMHRSDPKRPPNMQVRRSVIPITTAEVDAWLTGSVQQAAGLMRLAPAEAFEGAPAAA